MALDYNDRMAEADAFVTAHPSGLPVDVRRAIKEIWMRVSTRWFSATIILLIPLLYVLASMQATTSNAEGISGKLEWRGRPIPFADINICPDNSSSTDCYAATTGADGYFSISEIPSGTYVVKAVFSGGSEEQEIFIPSGVSPEITISVTD
jgi:hypothetical protein